VNVPQLAMALVAVAVLAVVWYYTALAIGRRRALDQRELPPGIAAAGGDRPHSAGCPRDLTRIRRLSRVKTPAPAREIS